MVKKKTIDSRLRDLEDQLIPPEPPWMRSCPDCGLAIGRVITVDHIIGISAAEALGCETCEKLRAELPPGWRVRTIEIVGESWHREEHDE
jgi:hypothetical protein